MFPIPTGLAFRFSIIGLFSLTLLGVVGISSVHPATANPVISISPAPSSHVGDGMNLEIEIHASLETGNPIGAIRVTLDDGTAGEKVYDFDINSKVIRTDAGFIDAFCDASLSSDGYSVGPSVVDCKLVLDKSILAAGNHQLRSELLMEIGTFTDNSEFTLLASDNELLNGQLL